MSRVRGQVKWFSSEKGYGFIQREGQEDVFVHHSQISMEGFRTLDAGEPVEFEIEAGDRGPKARDVARLDARYGGDSKTGTGRSRREEPGAERSGSRSTASRGIVGQIREKLFGRLTKHA